MNDPTAPVNDTTYEVREKVTPKYRIKFDGVRSLGELSDYIWYTPAPIYLWGGFDDRNWHDLISKTGVKLLWYKFQKPIFSGLECGSDPDWNYTLWGADSKSWEKIADFVIESSAVNIPNSMVCRYGIQELVIFDPLVTDSSGLISETTPKINVNAFCALTNKWQICFSYPRPGELPKTVRLKPSAKHQRLANRVLQGKKLSTTKMFENYGEVIKETSARDNISKGIF